MHIQAFILAGALGLTPVSSPGKTANPIDTLRTCVTDSVEILKGSIDPSIVATATLENIRSKNNKPPLGLSHKAQEEVQKCIDEYTATIRDNTAVVGAKKEYRDTFIRGSVGMIQRHGAGLQLPDGSPINTVVNPKEFKFIGGLHEVISRDRKYGSIYQYGVTIWGSELFGDGKSFYRFKTTYNEVETGKDRQGRTKSQKEGRKITLERIQVEGIGLNDTRRFAETGLGIIIHPTGLFFTKQDGSIGKIQLPQGEISNVKVCDKNGEWDCGFLFIGGKIYTVGPDSGKISSHKEVNGNLGTESAIPFQKAYGEYVMHSRKNLARREWSIQAQMIKDALAEVPYK